MLDITSTLPTKDTENLVRPTPWPMHVYLSYLVLIVLIPQMALSGLVAFRYASDARRSMEDSTQTVADAFAATLDRYLEGAVASIQTLATSSDFDDLRLVDARARQLLPMRGTAVSMRDNTGQQLVNTLVPFGTVLPKTAAEAVKEADARVFEAGAPVFSNLYQGTVVNGWFFLVDVPVERNGERQYALNIAVSAHDLRQAMFKGLPSGWNAAVVDAEQRVMARAVDQERFVGQVAGDDLISRVRAQPSGSLESQTLDGTKVYTSFVRSSLSSYTVLVSAPRSLLDQPIRELWFLLAGLAALSLISSVGAAWWWSNRGISALRQVEKAASASWNGLADTIQTPIVELNSLSASIAKAASAIREKTLRQERLIAELNHRVKNTLAILQAITIGTVQAKSSRDLGEALRFRIHGLSSAHDLLTPNDWGDVDLEDVLRAVASFTGHVVDQIEGPAIALRPKAVVALCQVFTELCEGAILCEILTSQVQWSLDADAIDLKWEGVCGPQTLHSADPFSLKIIHLCVDRQLGGRFEFQKNEEHWVWRCSIPLQSELGAVGNPA